DFRAGAFVGGGSSRMEVNFNAQEIEVWSAFGGLYARKDWTSHWIKAIVTGGWAGHESKRRVANNLVAAGIETAVGKYDGYFVSPAVTVGGRLAEMTPDHPVLGSVRVHYAGLFLDGYSETNVTTPLTVSSRDVHTLGGRAQLAFPHEQRGADGALFSFEARTGLDARFNLGGDRVNATAAGLPLNFTARFEDEDVSGFVGGSLRRTSADGRSYFKAMTEVHLAIDGSYEVRGRLGRA
ncbi:MAG: autotransporter outer membrane beta-barrel domain-containing protein, partial [Alphaproteobacteria bacterium]|nr:autotransporter outer membrane beta-barrel domain-containing protein [Alphaproteobacteria bacterium]